MKVLAYALAYVLLIAAAGFGFIAMTDTVVPQEEVTKDLPATQFIKTP